MIPPRIQSRFQSRLIKRTRDWRFLEDARRLLRFHERLDMLFFPIFGWAAAQRIVVNGGRSHIFPKSENLQLPGHSWCGRSKAAAASQGMTKERR